MACITRTIKKTGVCITRKIDMCKGISIIRKDENMLLVKNARKDGSDVKIYNYTFDKSYMAGYKTIHGTAIITGVEQKVSVYDAIIDGINIIDGKIAIELFEECGMGNTHGYAYNIEKRYLTVCCVRLSDNRFSYDYGPYVHQPVLQRYQSEGEYGATFDSITTDSPPCVDFCRKRFFDGENGGYNLRYGAKKVGHIEDVCGISAYLAHAEDTPKVYL